MQVGYRALKSVKKGQQCKGKKTKGYRGMEKHETEFKERRQQSRGRSR